MTRKRRPAESAEQELIRTAAVRLAWQLAGVAAALVLLAVLGALVIELVVHRLDPIGQHRLDDGGAAETGRDDDGVLRIALFVAGGLAVLVSGVAAFALARKAVAPLADALALQRRFVADAGHELRTPLTVLHTRAQLIERRMRPDDPARADVGRLLSDSRVLSEIVEEMLESANSRPEPARASRWTWTNSSTK